MKEQSSPARLGHLVRSALAAFSTDREVARRCLVDASALLESGPETPPPGTATVRIAVRPGSLPFWQVKRALAYIETNLESKIAIKDLASSFGISKSHFSRAFRHSLGCPPMTFVCRRRIERVKQMMTSERQRLSDIALACGFADQSHMNRVFRRVEGVSPGAWRRSAEMAQS